ncbi:MAG: GGDEF domain-containing protein, partial [Saprospiraceae bacterium]|nr:GGDEF domain-containing protein [Saprospiraceae bacterium]
MAEINRHQGGGKKGTAGDASRYSPTDPSVKEFNYVLQIPDEDLAFLNKYRETLAAGTARFAEVYYDYLFDNPDIADVLYAHERDGGDISNQVRAELRVILEIFSVHEQDQRATELVNAGRQHHDMGFKPLWVAGSYRLFLDFLRDLVAGMEISPADAERLVSVLGKLALRDLGLITEGYWLASLDVLRNELVHITFQHNDVESLLAGLPHLLWSVDVKENRLRYANYPLHALYPGQLDVPLPFLSDTCEDDRQILLTTWEEAANGNQAEAEIRINFAGGPIHWYRLSLYPSLNLRGRSVQVHCLLADIQHTITERQQLEQLSTTDTLTQLPNRALWTDHLKLALAASRRVPGSHVAVISLDINQFKMYNDTLGRAIGDLLLREIAVRLDSIVRESDSLARLGGDQFGILLLPVN